jgi:hypothetical protein
MAELSRLKAALEWVRFPVFVVCVMLPMAVRALLTGKPFMTIYGRIGKRPEPPSAIKRS